MMKDIKLTANIYVVQHGKIIAETKNAVTDDGAEWMAEMVTIAAQGSGTPTNDFGTLYLSDQAWSPAPSATTDADDLASVIAGTNATPAAGYPKSNDDDLNNPDAGVDTVTFKYSYSAAAFSATGIITGAVGTPTTTFGAATNDPLLNAFNFAAPFDKAGTDPLTVFVNIRNGV